MTDPRSTHEEDAEIARKVADAFDAREAERIADEHDAREADSVADEAVAKRTRRVTRQQANVMQNAAQPKAEDAPPGLKQVITRPKVIDLSSDSDDEELLCGHGENPPHPYESDDADDEVIQRRQETVSPEHTM